MIEGIPITLFDAGGWGTFLTFIVITGIFLYRGVIWTKGQVEALRKSYEDRITEIRAANDARIKDKDEAIANYREADRLKAETIEQLVEQAAAHERLGETFIKIMESLDDRSAKIGGARRDE